MTVWARWHRTRWAQQLICGLDVICLCLHAGGSEAALTAAAYRASSHQWGWQRITARQRQIPTIIWLMSRQRWARVIHTAGTEVVTPQEENIKNPCIPKWMPSLLNKVFFCFFFPLGHGWSVPKVPYHMPSNKTFTVSTGTMAMEI